MFATVDDLLALGIANYGGIQLHEDQLSFEDDEVMNRYNNLHAHLDELSQQEEKALQESEAKTSQGIEELRAFSE